MLSIHQECFEGPCVFYPIEGISIIFNAFLNFLLHFLPSWNPLGIFGKKKKEFLLNYTQFSGDAQTTCSLAIKYIPTSSFFSNGYLPFLLLLFSHFLYLPHLFTFSLTLQPSSFSTKTLLLSHFFSQSDSSLLKFLI